MKKTKITLSIIYLICGLLSHQTIHAQVSPWYHNMEKYWFYRYRLVNDFMLIGTECGNSIPAAERTRIYPTHPGDDHGNTIKWGDAGVDLGHYISALALENWLLFANGWNVRRTQEELYDALEAFDRLDRTAESYCEDIDNNFPCNPKPWTTPFTASWNNGTTGPLNGFFIRDDVPFNNHVDQQNNPYWDFITLNKSHFNRDGIKQSVPPDPANHRSNDVTRGDEEDMNSFSNRTPYPNYPPPWPNWDPPRYPKECNQDQMIEVFAGMGLATMLLSPIAQYNNVNLRDKAMDAAARMTSWVPKPHDWIHVPAEEWIDNLTAPMSSPWLYKNPLTKHCVYGIVPDMYDVTNSGCIDAGASVMTVAPAVAKAMKAVCVDYNYNLYNQTYQHMWQSAKCYDFMFQFLQTIQGYNEQQPGTDNGSMLFADMMAAFANNWKNAPSIPGCVVQPPGPNITFRTIREHAYANHFRTPQIPLIWRAVHAGPGQGTDLCPECHGLPSYEELLNTAPECGPYYYPGTTPNGEWSGSDRLGHYFSRWQWQFTGAHHNTDFNGLDYMELFNLHAYTRGDYLQFLINPYYMENFDVNYPDAYNGNIGSTSHKLQLNWLEYASFKNHVASNGYVTNRVGKTFDYIPGFEVETGGVFTAYVEDYDCHGPYGDYHFATDNGTPFDYNVEHMANALPRFVDTTTEYNDEDVGDVIDVMNVEQLKQNVRAYFEQSVKDVKDGEVLEYLLKTFGINGDGTWNRKNIVNSNPEKIDYSQWVMMYPNPTRGNSYVEYNLFDPHKVVIRLANTLGQDFSQYIESYDAEQGIGKHKIMIHSENLSPGLYYCTVAIDTELVTLKLTVY